MYSTHVSWSNYLYPSELSYISSKLYCQMQNKFFDVVWTFIFFFYSHHLTFWYILQHKMMWESPNIVMLLFCKACLTYSDNWSLHVSFRALHHLLFPAFIHHILYSFQDRLIDLLKTVFETNLQYLYSELTFFFLSVFRLTQIVKKKKKKPAYHN